jgi:hypothetical protein
LLWGFDAGRGVKIEKAKEGSVVDFELKAKLEDAYTLTKQGWDRTIHGFSFRFWMDGGV